MWRISNPRRPEKAGRNRGATFELSRPKKGRLAGRPGVRLIIARRRIRRKGGKRRLRRIGRIRRKSRIRREKKEELAEKEEKDEEGKKKRRKQSKTKAVKEERSIRRKRKGGGRKGKKQQGDGRRKKYNFTASNPRFTYAFRDRYHSISSAMCARRDPKWALLCRVTWGRLRYSTDWAKCASR